MRFGLLLLLFLESVIPALADSLPQDHETCSLISDGKIRKYINPSVSMVPAIYPREAVLVDTSYYKSHEPQLGDIIVFQQPNRPSALLIKRIMGMPLQDVAIVKSAITISGRPARLTEMSDSECAKLKAPFEQVVKDEVRLTGRCFQETVNGFKHTIFEMDLSQDTRLYQLRKDNYFVLGDNRELSLDSRNFGPVARDLIIGKVIDPVR